MPFAITLRITNRVVKESYGSNSCSHSEPLVAAARTSPNDSYRTFFYFECFFCERVSLF